MTNLSKQVQKYRKNLRKNGLRLVEIRAPDTRCEEFIKECARQSALVKNDAHEKQILKFLEAVTDRDDWTTPS